MSWSNIHKICILYNEEQISRKELKSKLEPFLEQVNARTGLGSTALHYACLGNNVELVSFLYHQGAAIKTNFQGETPLHWACQHGSASVVNKILRYTSYEKIMQKDVEGLTAMDWAKQAERPDLVKMIKIALRRKWSKLKAL